MCKQAYKSQYRQFNAFPPEWDNWNKDQQKKFWKDKDQNGYQKYKFYKHFRAYMIVNGIFWYLNMRSGHFFGSFPIAFFWGLGLFAHYVSVFGWPDANTLNGTDDLNDDFDQPEAPVNQPGWKDKDLV
jgi:hypothetical protein